MQFAEVVELMRRHGGNVQRGRPWRLPVADRVLLVRTLTANAATAVAAMGWPQTGAAALAWAVLVGTIVAFLMGRPTNRP